MTGDGREWRGDVRELPLDERRRLERRQCGGGRRRRPSSRCQEMVERGPGGGVGDVPLSPPLVPCGELMAEMGANWPEYTRLYHE